MSTTSTKQRDTDAIVTLHIANTESGDYDVRRPLPYPFHLDADGNVTAQDYWRGEPVKLLGFQSEPDVHQVDLHAEDWLPTATAPGGACGPTDPVGMWPVFLDADGTIWSHRFPVDHVTPHVPARPACAGPGCSAAATRQTYADIQTDQPWDQENFVPWCDDHAPADSWVLVPA